MEQQTWDNIWTLLQTPFRIQRAAYRRLHGGSNAPDITIGMAPKFLEVDDPDSGYAALTDCSEARNGGGVPTARTFIHFNNDDAAKQQGLTRVVSDPVLVLSH